MITTKIAITLLALLSLVVSPPQKCHCRPASDDNVTSWGRENTIFEKQEIVRSLRGRAIAEDQEPLEGVLVEVYDKPESLLMDWKERKELREQQHRIAACVTGAEGEFCFPQLPAGKYELRCSKPIEWNSTSIYVIVAPKDRGSSNAEVIVPLGLSH